MHPLIVKSVKSEKINGPLINNKIFNKFNGLNGLNPLTTNAIFSLIILKLLPVIPQIFLKNKMFLHDFFPPEVTKI